MRKAWEELNKRQIEERKQRNIDMKLSGILIRQIIGLRQDFKNGGKTYEIFFIFSYINHIIRKFFL